VTFGQLCKQEVDSLKNKELYKDTEVGRIPVDWEVKIWNEISDVRDGTHDSPKYYNDGVKFVTSKNIINGKLDLKDVSYISYEDAHAINQRSKVDQGDILMSMIGTIGDAVVVDFEPDFCIKNVALIKPDSSKILSSFMYQTIISNYYQQYIKDKLDGGIQKFISLANLRKLSIPLPPLPEQKAIAKVLSDIDELIETIEKLIHKKKQIKQGAMQELLTGKKRLAGFSGKWEVKKLQEIFDITAGGDLRKDMYSKIKDDIHVYPIYSNGLDNKGLYGYSSNYDYTEEAITVTARGTIGYAIYRDHKFCAIGRVLVLKPKLKINNFFVSQYINNNIEFTIENTGVPQLTAPKISVYKIPLPPLPEQKAIAQILSDMDAEIEALEKKLDKYRKIKEGMMEKLLTGQVRLV